MNIPSIPILAKRQPKELRIRPSLYVWASQVKTEKLWTLEERTYLFGIPCGWKGLTSHQELQKVLEYADHLCGVAR